MLFNSEFRLGPAPEYKLYFNQTAYYWEVSSKFFIITKSLFFKLYMIIYQSFMYMNSNLLTKLNENKCQ